jgi:methylated-DNA-[protein]-cysteine S-methyltransferase
MEHQYTGYCSSPLGLLKISASANYIQSIHFSDETGTTSNGHKDLINACIQQLDEYFVGSRKTFDLPLSQEGTDFQKRVWDLLYRIPYGKTLSYLELAKQYGDTKAIRAIASANGKNNLAIIVPCHRVIGSDRSLTGYAGGLWRKHWLLDHEAKYNSAPHQLTLEW